MLPKHCALHWPLALPFTEMSPTAPCAEMLPVKSPPFIEREASAGIVPRFAAVAVRSAANAPLPDIQVLGDPAEMANGRDPQLEGAIE